MAQGGDQATARKQGAPAQARALTFRRPISLTQSCLALASIISNILGERKKRESGQNPAPGTPTGSHKNGNSHPGSPTSSPRDAINTTAVYRVPILCQALWAESSREAGVTGADLQRKTEKCSDLLRSPTGKWEARKRAWSLSLHLWKWGQ